MRRPRPLLVGNGCYLVASFKNLFILKCIMKSWFRFSIFFFYSRSNLPRAKCEFYKSILQAHLRANTPEGLTTMFPNGEVSSITLKVSNVNIKQGEREEITPAEGRCDGANYLFGC